MTAPFNDLGKVPVFRRPPGADALAPRMMKVNPTSGYPPHRYSAMCEDQGCVDAPTEGYVPRSIEEIRRMYPSAEIPTPGTNPKDLIGETKPQLHLVPAAATIYMAKVFEVGATKYGAYNWRDNKVRRTVYLSAALRHILRALDGEDADPDTGMPAEASVASCMAIILDALATGNLVDDRPTPGAAATLIEDMTEGL